VKKSIALLFLTACSGAPFTVATQNAPLELEAETPDAALDVVAPAPEASAPVPEASALLPDVSPSPPDVVTSPPDVASPPSPEAGTPPEASLPPGTLCCRLPGPSPSDMIQMCPTVGPLTSYACGTVYGGWIYTRMGVNSINGNPQLIDVDCSYAPPMMKDIGETCRWPAGSIPSAANCGDVGAVLECP
jgi:hypothetical protein